MRKAREQSLPPLPTSVPNIHGPVPVVMVPDLRDSDGKELFGFWDPYAREIRLRVGMHPIAAWLTLWHEQTHADLSEIGVLLTTDQEEAVVSAIASQRVHDMLRALCL